MKVRTLGIALTSAAVGGVVGYSSPGKRGVPPPPVNDKIDARVKQLLASGYVPVKKHDSWWYKWHAQYMYSRAVSAQSQASVRDPKTGITETFYSIPEHLAASHMDLVYPTVFDEGLAEVAFQGLPSKIGVTGTLEIGPFNPQKSWYEYFKGLIYRGATYGTTHSTTQGTAQGTTEPSTQGSTQGDTERAERVLVLRSRLTEVKGRKSTCTGDLHWLDSQHKLAEGKVIMIEPWWAKYLALVL